MMTNPTEKKPSWLLPPDRNQQLRAGLYLVSTPIGNLGDMTLRALDVLAGADLVLCEDTRVTGKLLSHFGMKQTLEIYNDHSDAKVRAKILEQLRGGKIIALVSDAGTPLISDPGYKLVQSCLEEGLGVFPVPGANAVLPALQLSGMESDGFTFLGFLPSKQAARRDVFARWQEVQSSLVFYESAKRLEKTLGDIDALMGGRDVAVVREITKLYEEVKRGTAKELLEFYRQDGFPKGEIVIVLGPPHEKTWSDDEVESLLKEALETLPTKKAAAQVAQETGWAKSKLYDLALKLK